MASRPPKPDPCKSAALGSGCFPAICRGGYAALRNAGDTPLALIGVQSPDYGQVILHESTTHDGLSKMSVVERLMLPPHGVVKLAPGGYHLMLMHPLHPVKPGDRVKVTLRFADGSTLDVEFLARPANAGDDY